jgi:quercetin dioxygenase-like cupin family protein
MSKLTPDAHVHSDDLEWRPWDDERKAPFVAEGVRGQAWVKVLSRDPETEGESLMYRLDPGWSAESIENTVYENLLVSEGELEIDGTTLRKLSYSYRPEGHRTGPVSTATGATLIAYAGFPGELASSIPVPSVDTDAMEWWTSTQLSTDASMKMLRADEENLDVYYLTLVRPPSESHHVSQHDAPEEAFILEGLGLTYDGHTRGRHVMRAGTYVHRGPGSPHGFQTITEPSLVFKHDYFNNEELEDLVLRSFPRETEAVRAWRSGRMPELAKRW